MTEWAWVDPAAVIAWNAEFGGSILNENSVLSALARPANLLVYENADVADLAAAYAFGLVQNHGFVDGNKRSAWVTARAFLANGYRPDCGDEEAIELMVALVEHKLSESQVAQWFRKRL